MAARPPGGSDGPGRRRPKTPGADRDLWDAAMRDVRPLRRRPPAPVCEAPPPEPAATPEGRARQPEASPAAPPVAPTRPIELPALRDHRAAGLDKSSSERLKRGRYPIEARLDLHGMTQDEAHRALAGFIARASRAELRCVLVITGKGLRPFAEGEPGAAARDYPGATARDYGILRQAVPRWLNEAPTRAAILAFGAAQPRDGGSGALYVLLRRRR